MTFSINGIGTSLVGTRWLNEMEFYEISKNKDFKEIIKELPIEKEEDLYRFQIATESFCIFFIPIIPLKTFIYYSPRVKWHQSDKYIPLFYPNSKEKVSWEHVRKSWRFYLGPAIAVTIALISIFG